MAKLISPGQAAAAVQAARLGSSVIVLEPYRHIGGMMSGGLTQTDLASLVGASRERVNQVVVEFKEKKFISVDPKHHITVHQLQSLIECCQ